jgi:hypothetical protein
MSIIKVELKNPSPTCNPKYYRTDINNVKKVIHAWASGKAMENPEVMTLGMRDDRLWDRLNPAHERIRSRRSPFSAELVERTWLTSSWVQIGVNVAGAKILVDYTAEYLEEHYYDTDTPALEEIVSHIALVKEMYLECSVWSPEAWKLFPLSESPMDLQFPF